MSWTEEKKGRQGAERTNAVSSCGLEMSAGSASGFGLGEEPRDAMGVLEPPSPFEEPLVVTLSGWAERGDDILLDRPNYKFKFIIRLHSVTRD
jgi:hypothetical protein